jgi:hypothetical protein
MIHLAVADIVLGKCGKWIILVMMAYCGELRYVSLVAAAQIISETTKLHHKIRCCNVNVASRS